MANPTAACQFKVRYEIVRQLYPEYYDDRIAATASSEYIGNIIDAAITIDSFEIDLDQVKRMQLWHAGERCFIDLSNGSRLEGKCKGKITLSVAGIKQSILFDFSTPSVRLTITRIDKAVP